MSEKKLMSSDVFEPFKFPNRTYITRESNNGIDYEDKLDFALNTSGTLISINGASKMGKSVLCDKVIPLENQVSISGADFSESEDFWETIAKKEGMPIEGYQKEDKKFDNEIHGKIERFKLTKDRVIEYFIEENKVLILDDFHYAPGEVQTKIANQLKDAIRRGFRVIIVSLPHRSDAPIRNNSDLAGRLSLIDIESWEIDDLKEIIKKGFSELNIKISDDVTNKIAIESLTSPQLTQYICLSICRLAKVDKEIVEEINSDILEKAYKFTTANFGYSDVVNILSKGPLSKGKKRNIYKTKNGENMDLYQLIVESLADDPPLIGLTIDDIKNRVNKLIADSNKPDRQKIKSTVAKMEQIIMEKDNFYKVFECKEDMVYITEPLFLFFLRWGRS
ncbi:MAG: hypothetical protein ACRCXA_11295 [Peptostreptococcaceae bacterium]